MLNLPFLAAEIDSLPVSQGISHLPKVARRFTTLSMGLLVVGILTVTGCQNKAAQEEADIATVPQTVSEPTPAAPPKTQFDPSAVDEQASVAAAPNTTANTQIPQALVTQWEPLSNVLFEFGAMNISPDTITWNSGQTSSYTVVDTRDGYLLKLDAAPKFFDTNHPYIKLIPKQEAAGTVNEVEVAFYENQQKAESDEYIMFGTYTVQ